MQQAFSSSKAAMMSVAELAHPQPGQPLSLAVDPSGTHVGAVLHQGSGSARRLLGFFSVKLDQAQQGFSAFDRELLACYLAVRHFHWVLEGSVFHILCDHIPLTFALHRLSDACLAQQQRHLAYVAEFTSDIRHIAGKDNVVADALSRPAAGVVPSASRQLALVEFAKQQAGCQAVQQLIKKENLKVQQLMVGKQLLWCDMSTGSLRPLVPVTHSRKYLTQSTV